MLDLLHDFIHIDRLRDDLTDAVPNCLLSNSTSGIGADQNGRRLRTQTSHLVRQRQPVHPRHFEVEQRDVVKPFTDPAQRFGAIACSISCVPEVVEDIGDGVPDIRLIINDKNAASCDRHEVTLSRRVANELIPVVGFESSNAVWLRNGEML